MKMFNCIKKSISWVVVFCFTITSFSGESFGSAQDNIGAESSVLKGEIASSAIGGTRNDKEESLRGAQATKQSLIIPSELGVVDSVFTGATQSPKIYYIQDAHSSLEAQENIAKLISHLAKEQGIKNVYVEGYEGEVPLDPLFSNILDPKKKERVSYFFMDYLRLNGARYAFVNRDKSHNFNLIGIESTQDYLDNLKAYEEGAKNREQIRGDLEKISKELSILGDRLYPKEIKEWRKLKERFERKALSLGDYVFRMTKLVARSSQFVSRPSKNELQAASNETQSMYPHLSLVSEYLSKSQLSKTEEDELNQKLKAVDSKVFFQELQEFEKDFVKKYLIDSIGQQTFQYQEQINLLNKLNNFSLTPEEYQRLMVKGLRFTAEIAHFLAANLHKSLVLSSRWEESIRKQINFYELALKRDRSFQKNIKFSEPSIVVIGGFHKDGIVKFLEEQKASYVVVSPKITKDDLEHQERYDFLMTGQYYPHEKPFLTSSLANLQPQLESVANAQAQVNAAASAIDEKGNINPSMIQAASLGAGDEELAAERKLLMARPKLPSELNEKFNLAAKYISNKLALAFIERLQKESLLENEIKIDEKELSVEGFPTYLRIHFKAGTQLIAMIGADSGLRLYNRKTLKPGSEKRALEIFGEVVAQLYPEAKKAELRQAEINRGHYTDPARGQARQTHRKKSKGSSLGVSDIEKYLEGKTLVNGAFKGGGAKGTAYAGVLEEMEKEGYWFSRVAGTSAGAITVALIAAGYTASEIKEIVFSTDFNQFKDQRWWGSYVPFSPFISFTMYGGAYRGRAFQKWMEEKLTAKLGFNPRMNQLPIPLTVIASNISEAEMLVLNQDTAPSLHVAEAVRMSMGIPYFYEVHRWRGGTYNHNFRRARRVVDGGLLSNFPLFAFEKEGKKGEPVVGFFLKEDESEEAKQNSFANQLFTPFRKFLRWYPITHILHEVFETSLQARDKEIIKDADWARIVQVPVNVQTTQFDLTVEQKEDLAARGRKAFQDMFANAVRGVKGHKTEEHLEEKASKVVIQKARREDVAHLKQPLQDYLYDKILLNGVFKGGGAKGTAYVGALEEMEGQGYWFKQVAGTSAGAITAALISAGFTAPEIRDIVFKTNFNMFKDARIGLAAMPITQIPNLLLFGGLYRGKVFQKWLTEKLKEKMGFEPTFKDMPIPLTVVASDISHSEMLILNKETAPDLKVADAVRMSMSIPFVFEIFRWTGIYKGEFQKGRRVVDGGLLSNLPVFVYKKEGERGDPIVGFLLDMDEEEVRKKRETMVNPIMVSLDRVLRLLKMIPALSIAIQVLETEVEAWDKQFIEDDDWAKTVRIPVNVGTTEFDLSQKQKEDLAERGRTAVREYLDKAVKGVKGYKVKRDTSQPQGLDFNESDAASGASLGGNTDALVRNLIVPNLIRGYRDGRLTEAVQDLAKFFIHEPVLSKLLQDKALLKVLLNGMDHIAEETVKVKVQNRSLKYLAEGWKLDVYDVLGVPGVVVKIPNTGTIFKDDVLPGYQVAKENLGGLFAAMLLTNVSLEIGPEKKVYPYVIIQEKVKVLSEEFDAYEKTIAKEKRLAQKTQIAEEYHALVDRFINLQKEIFARDVIDIDLIHMRDNYGLRPDGTLVSVDVDGFRLHPMRYLSGPEEGGGKLRRGVRRIGEETYFDKEVDKLYTLESFKQLERRVSASAKPARRVLDPFALEVEGHQAAFLKEFFKANAPAEGASLGKTVKEGPALSGDEGDINAWGEEKLAGRIKTMVSEQMEEERGLDFEPLKPYLNALLRREESQSYLRVILNKENVTVDDVVSRAHEWGLGKPETYQKEMFYLALTLLNTHLFQKLKEENSILVRGTERFVHKLAVSNSLEELEKNLEDIFALSNAVLGQSNSQWAGPHAVEIFLQIVSYEIKYLEHLGISDQKFKPAERLMDDARQRIFNGNGAVQKDKLKAIIDAIGASEGLSLGAETRKDLVQKPYREDLAPNELRARVFAFQLHQLIYGGKTKEGVEFDGLVVAKLKLSKAIADGLEEEKKKQAGVLLSILERIRAHEKDIKINTLQFLNGSQSFLSELQIQNPDRYKLHQAYLDKGAFLDIEGKSAEELKARAKFLKSEIRRFDSKYRKAFKSGDTKRLRDLSLQVRTLLTLYNKIQLKRAILFANGPPEKWHQVILSKLLLSVRNFTKRHELEVLRVKIRNQREELVRQFGISPAAFIDIDLDLLGSAKITDLLKTLSMNGWDIRKTSSGYVVPQRRWVTYEVTRNGKTFKLKKAEIKDIQYEDLSTAIRSQIHTIENQLEDIGVILDRVTELEEVLHLIRGYSYRGVSQKEIQDSIEIMEGIQGWLEQGSVAPKRDSIPLAIGSLEALKLASQTPRNDQKARDSQFAVVYGNVSTIIDKLENERLKDVERIKDRVGKRLLALAQAIQTPANKIIFKTSEIFYLIRKFQENYKPNTPLDLKTKEGSEQLERIKTARKSAYKLLNGYFQDVSGKDPGFKRAKPLLDEKVAKKIFHLEKVLEGHGAVEASQTNLDEVKENLILIQANMMLPKEIDAVFNKKQTAIKAHAQDRAKTIMDRLAKIEAMQAKEKVLIATKLQESTGSSLGTSHLEHIEATVRKVAGILGLPDEVLAKIMEPEHVFRVTYDVELKDGTKIPVLAFRVQHNNARGPYKGGIRYISTPLNEEEAEKTDKALAFGMSLKTAAVNLPLGGGKGVVNYVLKPGDLLNKATGQRDLEKEKEFHAKLIRGYVRAVMEKAQKTNGGQDSFGVFIDSPAPDMGTGSREMAWATDEYLRILLGRAIKNGRPTMTEPRLEKRLIDFVREPANQTILQDATQLTVLKKYLEIIREPDMVHRIGGTPELGAFTGKPAGAPVGEPEDLNNPYLGGSQARDKATGQGGLFVLETVLKKIKGIESLRGLRAAVQGYGNVGGEFSKILYGQGVKIVAINTAYKNAEGKYVPYTLQSDNGIDIPALEEWIRAEMKERKVSRSDEFSYQAFASQKGYRIVSPDEFWKSEVDVVVPAAAASVITEKVALEIVAAAQKTGKKPIVLELANGPTTPEGDIVLKNNNFIVIPDILANAGGVSVSFFEMRQNIANERWLGRVVDRVLREKMSDAASRVIDIQDLYAEQGQDLSLREATYMVAVMRLASAEIARKSDFRLKYSNLDFIKKSEGLILPDTQEALGLAIEQGLAPEMIERNYKDFENHLENVVHSIQLKFALNANRHHAILVTGATAAGKSVVIDAFTKKLEAQGRKVRLIDLKKTPWVSGSDMEQLLKGKAIQARVNEHPMLPTVFKTIEPIHPREILILEGPQSYDFEKIFGEANVYKIFVHTNPNFSLNVTGLGKYPLTSLNLRLFRELLILKRTLGGGMTGEFIIKVLRNWPGHKNYENEIIFPNLEKANQVFTMFDPFELAFMRNDILAILNQASDQLEVYRANNPEGINVEFWEKQVTSLKNIMEKMPTIPPEQIPPQNLFKFLAKGSSLGLLEGSTNPQATGLSLGNTEVFDPKALTEDKRLRTVFKPLGQHSFIVPTELYTALRKLYGTAGLEIFERGMSPGDYWKLVEYLREESLKNPIGRAGEVYSVLWGKTNEERSEIRAILDKFIRSTGGFHIYPEGRLLESPQDDLAILMADSWVGALENSQIVEWNIVNITHSFYKRFALPVVDVIINQYLKQMGLVPNLENTWLTFMFPYRMQPEGSALIDEFLRQIRQDTKIRNVRIGMNFMYQYVRPRALKIFEEERSIFFSYFSEELKRAGKYEEYVKVFDQGIKDANRTANKWQKIIDMEGPVRMEFHVKSDRGTVRERISFMLGDRWQLLGQLQKDLPLSVRSTLTVERVEGWYVLGKAGQKNKLRAEIEKFVKKHSKTLFEEKTDELFKIVMDRVEGSSLGVMPEKKLLEIVDSVKVEADIVSLKDNPATVVLNVSEWKALGPNVQEELRAHLAEERIKIVLTEFSSAVNLPLEFTEDSKWIRRIDGALTNSELKNIQGFAGEGRMVYLSELLASPKIITDSLSEEQRSRLIFIQPKKQEGIVTAALLFISDNPRYQQAFKKDRSEFWIPTEIGQFLISVTQEFFSSKVFAAAA